MKLVSGCTSATVSNRAYNLHKRNWEVSFHNFWTSVSRRLKGFNVRSSALNQGNNYKMAAWWQAENLSYASYPKRLSWWKPMAKNFTSSALSTQCGFERGIADITPWLWTPSTAALSPIFATCKLTPRRCAMTAQEPADTIPLYSL